MPSPLPTSQTLKPAPEQGLEMEFLVSCKGQREEQKQQTDLPKKEFQVQCLGAVTPEKGENRILGVVPSFSLV